jgi:uncharacterized membrane protein YccC
MGLPCRRCQLLPAALQLTMATTSALNASCSPLNERMVDLMLGAALGLVIASAFAFFKPEACG